jgi:light-harvesting protein B-800-850 alpha chain
MNNGRIWCVVNPTVGLPLFLGSVALISFTVHFAVLSNTTWMPDFFNGSRAKKSASLDTAPAQLASARHGAEGGFSISVTPVPASVGEGTSFVVTVAPKSGGPSQTMALAQGTGASADGAAAKPR